MKNLFLSFFFLLGFGVYSQTKIDYDHFDENAAKVAFIKAFTVFRDTFTIHHLSMSSTKLDSMSPDMIKNPQLRKMRSSDWLYTNLSVKNCQKISTDNKLTHTDVTDWLETNKNTIWVNGIKNIKGLTSSTTFNIIYKENIFRTPCKFETYEDLANNIIKTWDKSPRHSAMMRSKNYSTYEYEKNNIVLTAIFSCSIKYNKTTNVVSSALNIVQFI